MKRTLDGITYNYIDPTGNITILVEGDVLARDYLQVADRLMKAERSCEQVGFIVKSDEADTKLKMASGEFCGNATMSAAALFADDACFAEDVEATIRVETAAGIVPVNITPRQENGIRYYEGQVSMPLPLDITLRRFSYKDMEWELPMVRFDGISHIIARTDEVGFTDDETVDVLKEWWKELRTPCLGIMLVDDEKRRQDSQIHVRLRPLVYAAGVETCFWESSCASGTTALAAYFKQKYSVDDLVLTADEPAGVLTVTCKEDGTLTLGGTVKIIDPL